MSGAPDGLDKPRVYKRGSAGVNIDTGRLGRTLRSLLVTAAIAALVVLLVGAFVLNRPERVLAEALERHARYQSLQVKGKVSTRMTMMGQDMKFDQDLRLVCKPPNKVVLEQTGGAVGGSKVVSNGEALFTEVAIAKMVLKLPAPKSVGEIQKADAFGGKVAGMPSMLDFVTGAADVAGFEKFRRGCDRKDEFLSGLARLDGTTAVSFNSGQVRCTVWVDRKHKTIRRFAMVMKPDQQGKEAAKGDAKGNPMAAMLGSMAVKTAFTFTEVKFDESLAPTTFAYQPKPGMRVIAGNDPQAIAASMMGAMGGLRPGR